MIGSELEQVYPVQVSRELLEIGCLAGSYELRRMQEPEKIAEIKALATAHFGVPTNVRITVLSSVPSDAPPTLSEKKSLENAERAATLRREAEAHPLVVAAVQIFDGEIAEVKEILTRRPNNHHAA
jgi:DNA polymerase-3 subunit gamma/tau